MREIWFYLKSLNVSQNLLVWAKAIRAMRPSLAGCTANPRDEESDKNKFHDIMF